MATSQLAHERTIIHQISSAPFLRRGDRVDPRLALIRDQKLRIYFHTRTQTVATRARPVRRIKRKIARLDLRDADPAIDARVIFTEYFFVVFVLKIHDQKALADPKRGFHRIGQPLLDVLPDAQAVDRDFDIVHLIFIQLDRVFNAVYLSINT